MPQFTEAYYFLGQCYNQIGEYKQAVRMFEKVIDVETDNSYAHYYLANNLFALKRMERALYHYQRVLEIDPDFVEKEGIQNMISEIDSLNI